jgi:hypothetical protein
MALDSKGAISQIFDMVGGMTATFLIPPLVTRWNDNNGNPLVGGKVFTYQGGTNTPLATFTDSTGVTQNTNPVILNFRGEAQIWQLPNISTKYVVQDSQGNLITTIDNVVNSSLISLYGGVDTGVQNAYILSFQSAVPPNTNGQFIIWLPANSNTGPSTINVNGAGPQPILNPNGSQLGANQILANQFAAIIEINGTWQLYGGSGVGVNVGTFGAEVPLPAAATTDLGSVPGHNVNITGTATITSFGTSAQTVAPIYIGRFSSSGVVLTQSASLILPGGNNITTTAGDAFIAEYFGGGNWRILVYQYIQASAAGTVAVKFTDTARNTTTTLAADPDLSINLLTGQYEYELFLLFDSVVAGAGFKFQSNGTAVDSRGTSPSVETGLVNAASVTTVASFVGAALTYATVSAGANGNGLVFKGSLLISTAGTFGISWAQNTSNASNTTLRAGSYLTANLLAQKTGNTPVQHAYITPGTAVETIPANVTSLTIEVFGGAGQGGTGFSSACITSGGGGGSSGSYARTTVSVAGQAGLTMNYTVGQANNNGVGSNTSTVIAGTFSIATMTAPGGNNGGTATITTGGAGGAAPAVATGGTAANQAGIAGSAGLNNAGGGTGGAGGPGVSGVNYGGFAGGRGHTGAGTGQNGGTGAVVFTYT